MERKQEGMGKDRARERERRNTGKIAEEETKERGRSIKREAEERAREKYLSLPEIPGMNGGINSLRGKGETTGWNAANICRKS